MHVQHQYVGYLDDEKLIGKVETGTMDYRKSLTNFIILCYLYTSQWMGTQFTNYFLSHCIVDRDPIIRGGLGYH
jgi:hypothetical protein